MGYTVDINTNAPTKRIKTFIGKDGTVYEGGAEVNLGRIGQSNPISKEPGGAK